jgi:HSP20 family protein
MAQGDTCGNDDDKALGAASREGDLTMTMLHQPLQTVPVQIHETDDHIVLTAPMPGLEPLDISVTVDGDRVTIRGDHRGSRLGRSVILVSEWTVGPYRRETTIPHSVNGRLTKATYGNGVLVLSMPKMAPAGQSRHDQFQLEVVEASRGQRAGHTGARTEATTTLEPRQKRGQ